MHHDRGVPVSSFFLPGVQLTIPALSRKLLDWMKAKENKPMIAIPGYHLLAKISESSSSCVYQGRREIDDRPVILKMLRSDYPTQEERSRYQHEYELIKPLDFAGAIEVYGLETYHNTLIMILEDFGGKSLIKLMNSRKFTLEDFLVIAIKITEIVGQIHAANIIHKDVNPSNLIVNPDTGEVKIIDFGIATRITRANPSLKNPNILEGTLAYMSPEQTGRMNRTLDYRTDFYSLGVTFYQLLTHQLPFDTTDAMELVHCHIAKQPLPPHQIDPEIPKAVSDIVMKLLAKTAEERYQSARGIKADLAECLNQFQSQGNISEFSLARQDISDKFQISQKLYGREREIRTLLTAFERMAEGQKSDSSLHKNEVVYPSQMMLVSGYSGIGKTSLVLEIYKPITQKRGYFIGGKFDQFQRNIPYAAIVSALSDLVRQILTETEDKINVWREKILSAIGVNCQIIIDVIPEVELIVGPQPAVTELPPVESQNRFNLLFQNFIGVFTKPEHPLVIFLDDLQWADAASLKLIQRLMTAHDSQCLFLIGAYRENEVNAAHPLIPTLQQIRQSGAKIGNIFLSPLDLSQVNQLISDSLTCPTEKSLPLAQLVLNKTGGNPFFMTEFLKSLYAEGLLDFDYPEGCWHWDLTQIRSRDITDNVVDLMAGKIQKLPDSTQKVLTLCACIGNQFDLPTLAIVYDRSVQQTTIDLHAAILEGLVLPLGDAYKSLEFDLTGSSESPSDSQRSPRIFEYKFAHDRIQQAAYSLIPDFQKQEVHYCVGQLLLENTPPSAREHKIFDIVNQLNLGRELINTGDRRHELASLNLMAGKKALLSSAYEPAFNYLKIGIDFLEKNSWNNAYDLSLTLYVEASEAALLSGRLVEMEQFTQAILQKSKTLLDKLKAYEVTIQACIAQNKPLEAIQTARFVLKQLGVTVPETASKLQAWLSLARIKFIFTKRSIYSLIDLPQMTDPYKKAAMKILSSITSASFIASPELFPEIAFKLVNLSIENGNAAESAAAYATYGLILCGVVGDIEEGYRFGFLALQLLERFQHLQRKAKTLFTVNCFLRHWKEHASKALKPFLEAYSCGLETGDLEFAAYSVWVRCYFSYAIGKELGLLEREMSSYSEAIFQLNQETVFNYNELFRQAVLNLLGKSQNPCQLIGEAYDETQMIPIHQKANDKVALYIGSLNHLMLCYLFEDYQSALRHATVIANEYGDTMTATILVPVFNFYDSLTHIAACDRASKRQQKSFLSKVAKNQKKMKKWAATAPMNHLQKFYLVEAERHRVLGQDTQAMDYYDRAIAAAKENEYINEEAIANELVAKYYFDRGKATLAKAYMQEAHYCYRKWGATRKVRHLEERYPQLFSGKSEWSATTTIHPGTSVLSIATESRGALDLNTVIKASQAISGEIVLDQLLNKLMKIAIENAGAEKGFLILVRDGELSIEVGADCEVSDRVNEENPHVSSFIPVDPSNSMPMSLINYVARTQENLVLNDAAKENTFAFDSYIQLHQPKSVLCAPIVDRGKLMGIIYLENNLAAGAFTRDRLEILKLLCSQAAISLQNALLYQTLQVSHQALQASETREREKATQLEQSLQDKTQLIHSLQEAQIQLVQSEKMSTLGELVAGVAHEINNPLGFISSNITYAKQYIHDIIYHLHLYQQQFPNPGNAIERNEEEIDLDYLLEDLPQIMSSMTEGTERIRNISTSLRTLSRSDTSQKVPFNIHEGIDSTLMILKHRLKATQNRPAIKIVKEYGELPLVECYPGQLNQVFMNIIANAIDALDDFSQKRLYEEIQADPNIITIGTKVSQADDRVIIQISDNGPGMPVEVKERIFDHLFTTKAVGKGTGLGLSISRQIVEEKHGGKLSCISALGGGTEFEIAIPL